MKKIFFLFWGVALCIALGATFINIYYKEEKWKKQESEPLVYYTIGKEDRDIDAVNEALNRLLLDRYGIAIDYRKLDWNIYGDTIADYLNLNETIDVVFAASVQQADYVGNAKIGAWHPLDEFLEDEGKELYRAIPETLWEGARINGHIYGVPTSKELAVINQWMYPKEIIEKYGIDIDAIHTLEDLEPVFSMLKQNEPEYTLLELNRYADFFGIYGYEYLLDYQIPLMVKSEDENLEIVNILETELGERTLKTLRKYYLCGYINKDAPIREIQTLQKGEKVFLRQAQGGPYAELEWTRQRGYEVVAKMMTPVVINTESVRGAYMCIPAASDKYKEACQFLLAVNTDKDVRNMLQYGIEGEHYTKGQDGRIEIKKDTYSGVAYTQGNYFILDVRNDQPKDLWEKYREFNNSAKPSQTLYFKADTSSVEEEVRAVRKVSEKFYPALMTGSVNVQDYLPKYREELRLAGIEKIKEELQNQLTWWKENEKGKNKKSGH